MIDLQHISFEGVGAILRPAPDRPTATPSVREVEPARDPDPFLVWLFAQAGLDHRAYRAAALERRLPACLRQLRAASPEAARALLEKHPERVPFALGTILIGVSEFFRDDALFRALGAEVLPRLLRDRPRLRVCSVGCSNGQELYSIAIQLAELGALDRCELHGMDCREEAVGRATLGLYGPNDLRNVGEDRLRRFFRPVGGNWAITPMLRDAARWRVADLFSLPEERFDLILCRNLMIYLAPEPVARAWDLLRSRLLPGGFLVTGKAERPPSTIPLLRVARSLYRAHS